MTTIGKLTPHQTNLVLDEIFDGVKSFKQIAADYGIKPEAIEDYFKATVIDRYNTEFAPPPTDENKVHFWVQIKQSEWFGFALNTLMMLVGSYIAIKMPTVLVEMFPNITSSVGEGLTAACTAMAKGLLGMTFIDTIFYFNESVSYRFLRNDGNKSFDYTTSFENLNSFEKCKLTDLKRFAYLGYFALLAL